MDTSLASLSALVRTRCRATRSGGGAEGGARKTAKAEPPMKGKKEANASAAAEAATNVETSTDVDYAPKNNADYSTKKYWDDRFETEVEKDWLCPYEVVREELLKALGSSRDQRILVVASGNSNLTAGLVGDGFARVTSTDFSKVVVDAMRERVPGCEWRVLDMTAMEGVADSSFDAVVDKAGMDALVAAEGKDPWNPLPGAVKTTAAMVSEVCRVLKPGGTFVQITFQQPHFRRKFLERDLGSCEEGSPWSTLEMQNIDHGLGYFLWRAETQTQSRSAAAKDGSDGDGGDKNAGTVVENAAAAAAAKKRTPGSGWIDAPHAPASGKTSAERTGLGTDDSFAVVEHEEAQGQQQKEKEEKGKG